jgi:TolB-like protein/Flp pilus assembly protein TadD
MKPVLEQSQLSPVSESEVRGALERVLNSEPFQRSPQLQRFLRYVVEETLAGHGPRLKEYVIGVEVFGRPSDYDPRIDSLVRVEARRLRGGLEAYYQTVGRADPVLIELHKGSYVPSFRERLAPALTVVSLGKKKSRWGTRLVVSGVLAALLAGSGLLVVKRTSHSTLSPNPTIAVLPFDNLSANPDNQYFCFGLMDEITKDLAKTGNLRVIARTSAARFKRGDDVAIIASQLKADAVLEGSVQRNANQVRVTAQLINAADRLHLWSESYDRSGSDLLQAQNEIAQAITLAVRRQLAQSGKAVQRTGYSSDQEANQLYWKAAYFRTPMGKPGWRKDLTTSAEFLEQAVRRDPNFALAYSALAEIYLSLAWERGGGAVTRDYMTRARTAALRALALDDTLAEAYGALGTIQFFFDYDGGAAEQSFQNALKFDPSNGRARMWYAYALVMQGRTAEALMQATEARELDPLSYLATTHLAVVHYFGRRNDDAIRLVRETLQVADTAPAHGLLGMAYEVQGNFDAAIAEYQAGLRLVPNHSYIRAMLGHAYARSGREKEARALLQSGNQRFEQGGLSDLKASYIYVGLGETDTALALLEGDFEQHDPELPYINADPVFDPIRNHPRFVALIGKMGLRQSASPR